jgi:hypothetical protein
LTTKEGLQRLNCNLLFSQVFLHVVQLQYHKFFFIGLLFNSCEKYENNPTEFREGYIGQYQVHETISSYTFPGCGEPYSLEKDTVISASYGDTDTTLNILGRDVFLDLTGRYNDYHYGLIIWSGSISSYFLNGVLGCGQSENYKGYRISNNP